MTRLIASCKKLEMENSCQLQMENRKESSCEEKKGRLEGLPVESSPYLKYKDLEDYKLKAYGTEGHQEVKPDQGGGGTDAPTLSGNGLSRGKAAIIDGADRLGIP
ncbi:unnamed protein product [Dovyalis caffra]|uniref:Uncharacterized protein n=1 Tax=Dovyalis caffra TaxID=77055 RepID=A0AAV1S3I5_9ROSI|nr:unnamed protein product [Dovyalis caffra]